MRYYKLFRPSDNHYGLQYKDGLNTDSEEFELNPEIEEGPCGIYFADATSIMCFITPLVFGTFIREITLPENEPTVKMEWSQSFKYYRAKNIILSPNTRKDLAETSTWEWMHKQGIIFTEKQRNYCINMILVLRGEKPIDFDKIKQEQEANIKKQKKGRR